MAVGNWYEIIYEMDFNITFCAGIKNILADKLSRLFVPYSDDGDEVRIRKGKRNNEPLIGRATNELQSHQLQPVIAQEGK